MREAETTVGRSEELRAIASIALDEKGVYETEGGVSSLWQTASNGTLGREMLFT